MTGDARSKVDVSIVIPAYNRLWSLPDAVASCRSGDGVEIVVVDDGSTDGTWRWLQQQPGIVVVRQVNQGKPAAVNAGVAIASGTYVRFLDSDDMLTAEAGEQLRHTLEAEADICVAGYVAQDLAHGTQVVRNWHDCGDFLAQQLGECDSSHYSAYLFRRAFIADIWHRSEFAFRDDRMFVLECAMKDASVTVWPKPTLLHRHHDRPRLQFQPGSVAVVTNWQELQMFRQVANRLEEEGRFSPRRRAAMANNIWPLALRIAGRDRREGRKVLDWLWSIHPEFEIPSTGVSRLYRALGVPVAQTIVNGARRARNGWRGVSTALGR